MSEKIDLNSAQKKLAETLKGIGIDLWGKGDPDQWADQAFSETAGEQTREQILQGQGNKEEAPKPAAAASRKQEKPLTIENLWITADETIDWTEALISETPRDGLTGPKRWAFYHRMAERVLTGDLKAYVEVLTTLNPLGDLTDFVSGMVLRAPAEERLECEFECQPEFMAKDAAGYLSALSVRTARDLLAVLPVEEVHVTGNAEGERKLDVTFRREQLLKRKMAFLNPVEFVAECGGQIRI